MGEVKNNAIGGILNGPYCKSVTFSSVNPLLITQFILYISNMQVLRFSIRLLHLERLPNMLDEWRRANALL